MKLLASLPFLRSGDDLDGKGPPFLNSTLSFNGAQNYQEEDEHPE